MSVHPFAGKILLKIEIRRIHFHTFTLASEENLKALGTSINIWLKPQV